MLSLKYPFWLSLYNNDEDGRAGQLSAGDKKVAVWYLYLQLTLTILCRQSKLREAMKSDKNTRGEQDKGIMSPAIVDWCPQPKLLIAFLTGMSKLCFSFKSVIIGCISLYT
jgi:hypothetical protein